MPQKAQEVFGARAAYYATSPAHADRQELEGMVKLVGPKGGERMLDVATGPGHTALAFAPHVKCVVGIDLTPQMLTLASQLAREKGVRNLQFERADVMHLPFQDHHFDLVTCRRAAHHFLDIQGALGEMRRVLRRGGRLLIEDRSVPEDDFVDQTMNRLDVLHDPSHVREYRLSEWQDMLQKAGFTMRSAAFLTKHRPIGSLTDTAEPQDAQEIMRTVDSMDDEQRRRMGIDLLDGTIHLDHYLVLILAEKG